MGATTRWGTKACHCACLALVFALSASWRPALAIAALAPDKNGVIHACYGLGDRNELHIIGGRQCLPDESPLPWNQRGRPGPSGSKAAATNPTFIFAPSYTNASSSGNTTNTTTTTTTTTNISNSRTTKTTTI